MHLTLTAARRRIRLLAALCGMGLAVVGSFLPAHAVDLQLISQDPYANPESQHQTEVEPDTYAFGATVVSSFQVGRVFDGGASNIGWATSQDNGATWTNGFLPGITVNEGGPYARASDPSVAYDAAHDVWMVSSLGIVVPVRAPALLISRSLDGGLTWDAPVTAVAAVNIDKNWTVCDNWPDSPFFGNCYNEWDDVTAANVIRMNVSSDGGLTWGAGLPTADTARGLGGQPVVLQDGTVVVPYSANGGPIRSFLSHDGGASWSASTLVSNVFRHATVGLRSPALPSAEVGGDNAAYVVWSDCRFRAGCTGNDIVLSTSTDGTTWSSPARVPIDDVTSGADHFIPGIAANPAALVRGREIESPRSQLGLAYYFYPVSSCTTATCQLFAGFISSPDGGQNWSDPVALTDAPMSLSWLANTNQGRMVGDYISTSFLADGSAHPVIAVASEPGAQFDEAMYTPVAGLAARAARGAAAHRSAAGEVPAPDAESHAASPRAGMTLR